MAEMSDTTEKLICLYPGCEREAVESPRKADNPKRQGPPPRYCDLEEHNIASTHLELKRLEAEGQSAESA